MSYDYQRLLNLGIEYQDAVQLRRISMTLQRWFELECGDSNDYASWCITRGHKTHLGINPSGGISWTFEHNDDGKPYIERHIHTENKARYEPIADREAGAKRRLARIMAKYPSLWSYIQTDPRGAALYIGRRPICEPTDSNYSHGVAVHK